jgi:hypothetical protein
MFRLSFLSVIAALLVGQSVSASGINWTGAAPIHEDVVVSGGATLEAIYTSFEWDVPTSKMQRPLQQVRINFETVYAPSGGSTNYQIWVDPNATGAEDVTSWQGGTLMLSFTPGNYSVRLKLVADYGGGVTETYYSTAENVTIVNTP